MSHAYFSFFLFPFSGAAGHASERAGMMHSGCFLFGGGFGGGGLFVGCRSMSAGASISLFPFALGWVDGLLVALGASFCRF